MAFPLQLERQYLRAVERFLNALDKEVMKAVKENVDYRKSEPVQDDLRDIVRRLSGVMQRFEKTKAVKSIEKSIDNTVKSLGNFTNRLTRIKQKENIIKGEGRNINSKKIANSKEFKKAFKLFQVQPASDPELQGIVQHNVELIKTVGKEYFAKIQERIVDNIEKGKSQQELERLLQKDTSVERNRVKFWASDQLGKAYSDLTKKSQKEAGFTRYKWRTQKDDRVRDTHEALEGEVFDWDNPPTIDGRKLHPGEDYNCRCYAEPLLDDEDPPSPADRIQSILAIEVKKQKAERN